MNGRPRISLETRRRPPLSRLRQSGLVCGRSEIAWAGVVAGVGGQREEAIGAPGSDAEPSAAPLEARSDRHVCAPIDEYTEVGDSRPRPAPSPTDLGDSEQFK